MLQLIGACALVATLAQPADFRDPAAVPTLPAPAGNFSNSSNGSNPSNVSNLSSNLSNPTPRPAVLTSLYVSFLALQALDVHSTVCALDAGAREANPAMRGIAGNKAAFIAVKAAAGATTIWMSERVRKRHPKGAIVLMAVLNSAVATIVAHNYSLR